MYVHTSVCGQVTDIRNRYSGSQGYCLSIYCSRRSTYASGRSSSRPGRLQAPRISQNGRLPLAQLADDFIVLWKHTYPRSDISLPYSHRYAISFLFLPTEWTTIGRNTRLLSFNRGLKSQQMRIASRTSNKSISTEERGTQLVSHEH